MNMISQMIYPQKYFHLQRKRLHQHKEIHPTDLHQNVQWMNTRMKLYLVS